MKEQMPIKMVINKSKKDITKDKTEPQRLKLERVKALKNFVSHLRRIITACKKRVQFP